MNKERAAWKESFRTVLDSGHTENRVQFLAVLK
jgi:hypothetical protein